MITSKSRYKPNYNAKGAVIPPQTMGTPFGFALAVSVFLLPFAPRLQFFYEGASPLFFQFLPSFWALRKADLISNSDLAKVEMFTAIYVIARLAYFPFFRSRYVSFFSEACPPPVEMDRAWPSQISGAFKAGAILVVGSLTLGLVTYFENALNPKYAFCILEAFGGGCMAVTEGFMDLGLYSAFRSRFWHKMPHTPDGR